MILANLGVAHGQLGHSEKMRDLLERALIIEESSLGPEDVEVGRTLLDLSNAYAALGDVEKQQALLRRANGILDRSGTSYARKFSLSKPRK